LAWLYEEHFIPDNLVNMNPRFIPAARGWQEALHQYLEFLRQHKGVESRSMSSWLRCFTRRVATEAAEPARLTLARLDSWLLELTRRSLSARTVRGYVGVVRGFLSWLFDERLIANDLAASMQGPVTWQDQRIPEHFTWPEVQQLLESIDLGAPMGLHDQALVLLLTSCGLRPGEVVRLTVDDVDLEHQTVRLRARKNGTFLLLPLPSTATQALRRYQQEGRQPAATEAFFLTWQARPYRNGNAVSNYIRRLAKRAGLPPRGAQALRRAVGTRLMEEGATPPQVALMLGHEGQSSIRHYIRVSMTLLAEVADNYAEIF
jgi:site-specific recombinase XerD